MALDIRSSDLKDPIDLAEYLFRRLHEVGIRSVHGVPGDYNLVRTTPAFASFDVSLTY